MTEATRFHHIHIGKCGGSTLITAVENSERVKAFPSQIRTHLKPPDYSPNDAYLISLRNPVRRALSAFNWRHHLIHGPQQQKGRHQGERDTLGKYGALNPLAEKLYDGGDLNHAAAEEFRSIQHLYEDIAFYLKPVLAQARPGQFFAAVTQENIAEDIKRTLGVESIVARKRGYPVTDAQRFLSATAIAHIRRFFIEDYKCIMALRVLDAITEEQFEALLRDPD